MLNNANVLLAIDRAGLVPGDGVTHQGIYDVGFLSQMDNLLVVSPANYAELRFWLRRLLREYDTPRALRYPRGASDAALEALGCSGNAFDLVRSGKSGGKTVLVSYGTLTGECLKAAGAVDADVYKLTVIHPIPAALVQALAGYETVLFAEESVRTGSIGQQLYQQLGAAGFAGKFIHRTVENVIDHASVSQLRCQQGLDAASLIKALQE
jgi:1-deoxy-D-xylulose-5-phosphate synthase